MKRTRPVLPAMMLGLMPITGHALAAESRTSPWSFRLQMEAAARYDDNILGLSSTEKDAVDPDDPANHDRFRITRPDDFIFVPSVGVRFIRAPEKGRETGIGVTMRASQYLHNQVKNYQQYGISLRQELSGSRKHRTTLVVGASRIPRYYLRQLVDDDESTIAGMTIHNSAIYEMNRGYITVTQEIIDRVLAVSGGYARERRNFNLHFDERDSSSHVVTLDADIYPAKRLAFRIRPYYERESRESRGDLTASTTVTDDDVGFDSNLYGLELRGLWGPDSDHRRTLRGYYQKETRDFVTGDSSDTGHFGREDDITRYGVGYNHEMGPRWEWALSAYHRENDPSISSSTFEKNVVALSIGYNLDTRTDVSKGDREGKD